MSRLDLAQNVTIAKKRILERSQEGVITGNGLDYESTVMHILNNELETLMSKNASDHSLTLALLHKTKITTSNMEESEQSDSPSEHEYNKLAHSHYTNALDTLIF